MSEEIKINKHSGSITFTNNEISFSQFGIAKEILDLITNLQQKIEQLEKENKELKEENKHIFQNVNDDELLISNAMNYVELKKAEKKIEQLENIRKEATELIKKYQRKDEFLNLNEWQTRDLLNILNKESDKK